MALLFQSSPDQWNLRRNLKPGRSDLWFVSRYQALMQPGRLVLLWEAKGTKAENVRGLYGWGVTIDELTRDTRGRLRIRLQYIERWVSKTDESKENREDDIAPIAASEVLGLNTWRNHLLSVFAAGTNFVVTPEQLEELSERIVKVRFPKSKFREAVEQYVVEGRLDPKVLAPDTIYEGEE